MASGPGKGNTNNPNGRPKGIPNRTTKQAKELLEGILFGQIENIADALDRIRKDDPAKYIDACSKMFAFVLPKKTDMTSGDEPLKQNLTVLVDSTATEATLRKLRKNG